MSKTAEEMLNEHFAQSVPTNTPMWDSAINAANEFADQEVEAYKERLRTKCEKIRAFYGPESSLSVMVPDALLKLIDTVK